MLIQPYYHPTTIVFADDNISFLESIALSLPAHLTFKAFSRAEPAEAYLHSLKDLPDLPSRCIESTLNAQQQPVLTFNLDEVEREISNPARFERVSVVVIDFAMPDRDGLEMARAIKHLPVKKLLLTGVADEKTAVAAFNEGIIDRFVQKSQGEVFGNCAPDVELLTRAYFEQYVDRLITGVNAACPAFLNDPDVAQHVNGLLQQYGAVEHYLVADPPGLLMLNLAGKPTRIAVASRAEREAQRAYAKKHGAPRRLLTQMNKGTAMGYFVEPVESYFGERYPWRDNIIEGVAINDGDWTVAVIEDAPADIDFDQQRCCYGKFLSEHRAPVPKPEPDPSA